jgi:hypothetical protein
MRFDESAKRLKAEAEGSLMEACESSEDTVDAGVVCEEVKCRGPVESSGVINCNMAVRTRAGQGSGCGQDAALSGKRLAPIASKPAVVRPAAPRKK